MKIEITAAPKEIADLVLALQDRLSQNGQVDVTIDGKKLSDIIFHQGTPCSVH